MGTISKLDTKRASDISKVNDISVDINITSTASLDPTVTVSPGAFGLATAEITNHSSYTNPNYSAELTLASDGTVAVTNANIDRMIAEGDTAHIGNTLSWSDTNTGAGDRIITIRAQEMGDEIQSTARATTYTPVTIQNKYIRITGVDSTGSATAGRLGIIDIIFYADKGQTGTSYPTTNLTSNTSETGIVISAGHSWSGYDPWKAADNTTGSATWWWALGTTAANNWWQIEFESDTYSTAPEINSMRFISHSSVATNYFKITGSQNADHSSATDYGTYYYTSDFQQNNYG